MINGGYVLFDKVNVKIKSITPTNSTYPQTGVSGSQDRILEN
jgi:hypothetical protein